MTSMVGYESYLFKVLPDVDGCPPLVAEDKIREAVIELCQSSSVWRKTLDTFYLSSGTPYYKLILDEGEQLAQLSWGYIVDDNGERTDLNVTSEDAIDAASGRGWRSLTGGPTSVFMLTPETVRFATIPTERYAATLGAHMKPTPDSYEAPSFIFNQYIDTVAAGAKAKLLNMKGRAWYDPGAAAVEEANFKNMKQDVRNSATKGNTNQPTTVTMRPFA